MLIFLPGVGDINEARTIYMKAGGRGSEVLFAAQNSQEQEKMIKQGRVFFATSLAETSLTFHNLKYVIDAATLFNCTSEENTVKAALRGKGNP